MKKFSLIALAALAVAGFSSCDEYTLPNPPAQENPAEPVFNASDLTVTTGATTIDMPALQEANEKPALATVGLTNFPSTSTLRLVLQMSADDTFSKVGEVTCTVNEENVVEASTYDLQSTYNATISRSLDARDIYTRYAAYSVNGNEVVRIGGPDVYYATATVHYVPVLITHVIEPKYYLVGDFCNWQVNAGTLMTQTVEGDQYDNPVFRVIVDVDAAQAAAGYTWKVVPGSAYDANNWEGAYGAVPTSDDDTRSGKLVASPEAETNAGVITEAGRYSITIDMQALTYEVGYAYEQLWVNANGWYTDERMLRLSTDNYINYGGVARINRTFSLWCQATNDGVGYGADGDSTIGDDGVASGKLILSTSLGSVDRMNTGKNSLFYVRANLVTLEWSAAPIESISLVGAFNGWNTEDEAATMTGDTAERNTVWTIENVELPADEFKFCVNHAWTLSFGGALDNIVENGGNIKLDEAGTYDVTLDFRTIPYTATLTKK